MPGVESLVGKVIKLSARFDPSFNGGGFQMALFFILNDGHEIQWHVNVSHTSNGTYSPPTVNWSPEKKPEIWQFKDADGKSAPRNATTPMRHVVAVSADGHELEYILRIFNGLPSMSMNHPRYGRGITWRGDLAAFIYDNL